MVDGWGFSFRKQESSLYCHREWAMPNKNTFSIKPIYEFVLRHKSGKTIDPFANTSRIADVTNDLNPDYDTDFHLDSLEFLKTFDDESVDTVLFDPPYSLRQVSESYKNVGREVTMETTQASWRSKQMDEIARILKKGGKVLCFGWNSNGVGKTRGFDMVECMTVAHGGSHNDTICTAEIKG